MFASRRTGASLTSGADRWLVLAGAGLLVLGLVLRLLTDIGRSTAGVDTLPPVADSRAAPPAPAPTPDTAAAAESTSAVSLGAHLEPPREHAEPAPPGAPPLRPAAAPTTPVPAPAKAAADTPARAGTAKPTGAAAGGWQVQLGVFGQAANAEKLRARVETLGFTTDLAAVPGPDGERHRVRVVGFRNEAAARAAADSVFAGLGVRGVVLGPGR